MAERVAGGEPLAPQAVAGLLAGLAGKSLVQVQAGAVIRYSLLETVRQFAAGRLAASGEETAVQAGLLRWALEVAIQPATVAALDEAATVIAAHPDPFAETVMRRMWAELFATLGQLDPAETEVGLCWGAGRSGALRVVEFAGPLAEARLAAARGDIAAAIGALRQAADGGRRVGIVMQVPAALARRRAALRGGRHGLAPG